MQTNIARVVFACALVATSGTPRADWSPGFTNGVMEATVYVDPFSVRKDGDLLKARVLSDFKAADTYLGVPYVSVSSLKEFDCKTSKVRTVRVSLYSGPMATGELVAPELPVDSSWKPLTVGDSTARTTVLSMLSLVCGRGTGGTR